MQAWADVALLTKTKTHIGGFVVRCTTGLSFLLEPGMEVAFVPPRIDCPRKAHIVDVGQIDGMTATVTFDAFASMQQMQEMVGAHCLVDEGVLDSEAFGTSGLHLSGMRVVDGVLGELGPIIDVVSNPGQDLLVVDCASRGKGEVMIPCVDAFITGVDEDEGVINTSIPAGLLDL